MRKAEGNNLRERELIKDKDHLPFYTMAWELESSQASWCIWKVHKLANVFSYIADIFGS